MIKYGIKKSLLIIFFTLGFIFTWYCIFMQPDNITVIDSINSFFSNFPCWNFFGFLFIWLLGVACFYFSKNFKVRLYLHIVLFSVLIIIFVLFLHYICNIPFVYNPYPGLTKYSCPSFSFFMTLAYSLPMLLLIYCLQFIRLNKYLGFIGILGKKYSYTLYASHFILLNFAFGLLSPYLSQYNIFDFIVLFIIIFLIANIIAFYLAKILENRALWMDIYDKIIK